MDAVGLLWHNGLIGKLVMEAEQLDIPVVLWDERLSTAGADEVLEESGIAAAERKQYIDKIAAAFILEDYMKNS